MFGRNDQLVRHLESECLDAAHFGLAIFRRGQLTAVSHIFKVLGDLLRDFENGKMEASWPSQRTMAGLVIEAAEHALRWVLSICPKGSHRPAIDWQKKDDESLELLRWAINYAQLYADHTAWSRGMMLPLVDEEKRVIMFDYPQETHIILDQIESEGLRAEVFAGSIPQSVEQRIVTPWMRSISSFKALPVVTIDRKSDEFQDACAWGAEMIFAEIDGEQDLGGFMLNDFRRFFVALWINCHCIARLENMADDVLGQTNPLGSRVLQGHREAITYWLSQVSTLGGDTIKRILALLTFDPAHRHPSLPGHPFVLTPDGALTLMPRLIARTEPNVMLSVALNTGSTRPIYESIIGQIEGAAKQRLAAQFAEHGYSMWKDPLLRQDGAQSLTPDLIVSRRGENCIVVLEYKHALPPRGSAGVSDRIKEASKWIQKAKRYLKVAKMHVEDLRLRLGIAAPDPRVVVAIVPRWPMPVPISIDSDDVVIAALARVERGIRGDSKIVEVFGIEPARTYPMVKREFHDIKVDDWIYKHPIFVGDITDSD